MGLDCCWKGKNVEKANFDPPIDLLGTSSFRGRAYYDYIFDVTDESLYNDLDNQAVEKVAMMLEATGWEPNCYGITKKQHEELVRMFKTYGRLGCWLYASY